MVLTMVVPPRPNPILVPMINEALRLVVQWTPARIQARLQKLTRTLAAEVAARCSGAFYMFPGNGSYAAGHIAGIRLGSARPSTRPPRTCVRACVRTCVRACVRAHPRAYLTCRCTGASGFSRWSDVHPLHTHPLARRPSS